MATFGIMEDKGQPQEIRQTNSQPRGSRSHRRSGAGQKWDSLKADIYLTYVAEKNTLQSTMRAMEQKYSFKSR
jgi:hypothetical protein